MEQEGVTIMTDEQERKLYKMDDQKLLIELSIAYGNTTDADLGSYHRRNLMAIFKDLNLDHMVDWPGDADTKLLPPCDNKKEGSDT
jgi:hypothetical protein